MAKKLKITLVKSVIGTLVAHKRTVAALGLKKIRSSVVQDDTAVIRGMIDSIKHIVKVETVDGE